jgi:amino acid transporter
MGYKIKLKWNNLQERIKKVIIASLFLLVFWFIAFAIAPYLEHNNTPWYCIALFWYSILNISGSGAVILMEYVEYLDCKGFENKLKKVK